MVMLLTTLLVLASSAGLQDESQDSVPQLERRFEAGTKVRLRAVPEDGWEFVEWQGAIASDENPIEVTIDADMMLKPVFRRTASAGVQLQAPGSFSLRIGSVSGGRVQVDVVRSAAAYVEMADLDLLEGVAVVERPGRGIRRENKPATAVALPEAGACINDPEFGTRICRVTDAEALGFEGAGVVPMYGGTPAWNADESLLLLYAPNGNGHQLFRGQPPYAYVGPLDVPTGEPETVYWDPNDPVTLRWIDKVNKRLMVQRIDGGSARIVHDFQDICGSPENKFPLLVETHHWQSFDGRYWGFKCDPGDGNKRLIAYDLAADRILWNLPYTGSSTRGIWGAPVPSPRGNYFVTRQNALEIRDRDSGKLLRTVRPDLLAYSHFTLGIAKGSDGEEHEVYVTLYNEGPPGGNTTLVGIDLATGKMEASYVSEAFGYPYPPSGIHHSAISYRQPNFVWTSVIGSQSDSDPRQTDGQLLLGSEVLVTDLRDGRVGRVAHHRSRRGMNPVYNATYNDYWQEPHITASPTGCRAVFGSDWSAGPHPEIPFQPKVDTFVVELPCFERPEEPAP